MRSSREYLDLAALATFVDLADQLRVKSDVSASLIGAAQAHIARLESNLGVKLVEISDDGHVQLSGAGQRLHQSGLELLASTKSAFNSVVDVSHHPAESAVFAAPPTVAAVLASAVAVRFHEELKSARLRIIEGMSGHIREWLATGRVDAGILLDSYDVPGEALWSEQFYLVADSALVPNSVQEFNFKDLASLPMLLPSGAHGLRHVIDRQAERCGIKLDVRLEGDSLNTLMDWVIEGLGVAVLPMGAIHTHHRRSDSVRLIPLVSPKLERHLILCTASNKHPSATVRALLKIVREEAVRLKPSYAH